MANFIVLKRPGPPTREVLVNLDQILMVPPGQGTGGSAILFDREHVVTFEEDFATVIRRIQTGPYVEPGRASPPKAGGGRVPVFRCRSSHPYAASSSANFGLAAAMMRTSEPPRLNLFGSD